MNRREERRWELINEALAAESSGRSPRLFSSRRTLFGIPSALDQELEALTQDPKATGFQPSSDDDEHESSDRLDASDPIEPMRKHRKSPKGSNLVIHPLDPVFDNESKVLILGTMPSPRSRETGFYYNHPQNRFWKVMAALFEEGVPVTNEQKKEMALRHHVALWDVLAQCSIEGASDASIAECIPNDVQLILTRSPIKAIFCTGAKAYELYGRYCEPSCGIEAVKLPSTSSANASMSLEALVKQYRVIVDTLTL